MSMAGMSDFTKYWEQYPLAETFEPLAQTWHGKIWWWIAKSIECENNLIATYCRARAGLNPEPGTTLFDCL